MKKYVIVIKYKDIEVIRVVIGAINSQWAQTYADNLQWGLMKGNLFKMENYESSIDELKDVV